MNIIRPNLSRATAIRNLCSVYGNPGEFYEANDESETNELVWFDSEQGILFALSSDLDQETMLKVAESVTAE